MNFKELGLSKKILDIIEKEGYENPTKIQEKAIPIILEGKDVLGVAQTGTGKTAAFSLPIIEKLINQETSYKKIKALIITPTRELAIQIRDNIRMYSSNTNLKCGVVLGGVNQQSQISVLKKGVDILVATPGRLVDLTKRRIANLSCVETIVLDEADTMLDMGFIEDIKYVMGRIPKNRQTLLFSATMDNKIQELGSKFLNKPQTIITTKEVTNTPKIRQLLYCVDKTNKFDLLLELLSNRTITTALVFTRTKIGANRLYDNLKEYGIKCEVIHGDKTQQKRVKALNNFKGKKSNVLIATDIAARGIDINELSHVINYDMPEHPEIYIHRIGRTARAGLEGTSISICTKEEKSRLYDIERLINSKIEIIEHPKYSIVFKKKKDRLKEDQINQSTVKKSFKRHSKDANEIKELNNKKNFIDKNKRSHNKPSSLKLKKAPFKKNERIDKNRKRRKNIKHDLY